MPVKTKLPSRPTVKKRAEQLLAWAEERARACASAAELYVMIFGSNGKAHRLFPTTGEWTAFERCEECAEIQSLLAAMASSAGARGGESNLNGDLYVAMRLPKSVHAALQAEAAAQGVSLDQLCLSKLVAQLPESLQQVVSGMGKRNRLP